MQPLLSVLITSLPERLEAHLLPLWRKLTAQAAATGAPTQVELVSLLDNRTRTIGEKREDLVQIARGLYVAFVDDDDDISPDYLPQLLAAIATTSLTPHASHLTPHTSHLTPHTSRLTLSSIQRQRYALAFWAVFVLGHGVAASAFWLRHW